MAEKLIDKLKRLSRDLAESVRTEIELSEHARVIRKELSDIKKCITCYLADKEGISDPKAAISFIKGYQKAKSESEKSQMAFDLALKK